MPVVLTSRVGEVKSALTIWCHDRDNRRPLLVMFVGAIEYGYYGLITAADYTSILHGAGLQRVDGLNLSSGTGEIWQCKDRSDDGH
jgi:hypothetical protein